MTTSFPCKNTLRQKSSWTMPVKGEVLLIFNETHRQHHLWGEKCENPKHSGKKLSVKTRDEPWNRSKSVRFVGSGKETQTWVTHPVSRFAVVWQVEKLHLFSSMKYSDYLFGINDFCRWRSCVRETNACVFVRLSPQKEANGVVLISASFCE